MRHSRTLLGALGAALALAGCGILPQPAPERAPEPPVARQDSSLAVVAEHLDMMRRLNQGSPTEQAELFKNARDAAQLTPTTSNLLRYALALSTPGHGMSDAADARQRLSELLASPEKLLPAERSLAAVALDHVEQRLVLQRENEKLQADSARTERERGVATSRRLQAEIEENNRLRKALKEAQDKLDEIARIERSIIDRKPGNTSR